MHSQASVTTLVGGSGVLVGETVSVGVGKGEGVNVKEVVLDISRDEGVSVGVEEDGENVTTLVFEIKMGGEASVMGPGIAQADMIHTAIKSMKISFGCVIMKT